MSNAIAIRQSEELSRYDDPEMLKAIKETVCKGATASEKLVVRLRKECGLAISRDATIQRTYAGRNQREAGAWSWCLRGNPNIGSHFPVRELAKSQHLELYVDNVGQTSIYPSREGNFGGSRKKRGSL